MVFGIFASSGKTWLVGVAATNSSWVGWVNSSGVGKQMAAMAGNGSQSGCVGRQGAG